MSGDARPHVVALTGAGISAESGLATFRDADGLWEDRRPEEVATPEAWARDPELVQRFYNERRRQVAAAEPNAGHRALARLQETHRVRVVTQNIDDLHERAGSRSVLHLHGEILKARSSANPAHVIEIGARDLGPEDRCPLGSPLRPHVVWFGEPVPAMEEAAAIVAEADVLVVVGTSLAVYPAAGLVDVAPPDAEAWLVNPDADSWRRPGLHVVAEPAGVGLPRVVERLQARARGGRS